MPVLIAYESFEGHTGKIARFIEAEANAAGFDTRMLNTNETNDANFDDIISTVLAAPVHERRHPPAFENFLKSHAGALANCPTLLLSVSLRAAFPEGLEDARDYMTEMLMRTGLAPSKHVLVAGAVRPNAYDDYSRDVIEKVVLRGQSYDPTRALDFTDWDDLKVALKDFLTD